VQTTRFKTRVADLRTFMALSYEPSRRHENSEEIFAIVHGTREFIYGNRVSKQGSGPPLGWGPAGQAASGAFGNILTSARDSSRGPRRGPR
jgi:hypothetical protein